MSKRKFLKPMAILSLLVILALPVTTAIAWWSSWYSPGFSGSYSPTSYMHGQWNATVSGGTEAFGSQVQWDQTRANGVRAYSNNRNWIIFCGNCYSYYTHDHTDMSNKLSAKAYSTNFPNASIDTDDDNGNGKLEEIEVTSVNQSFPTANSVYYFYSYFGRSASGNGTVQETPQISAKNPFSGEWDSWRYDSYQALSYSTTDSVTDNLQVEMTGLSDSEIISTTTITLNPVNVVIERNLEEPVIQVSLEQNFTHSDKTSFNDYIRWVKNDATSELRAAGINHVLAVVTFKSPVSFNATEELLGTSASQMETVKAIFVDKNNPDPNSNVWTIGTWLDKGDNYQDALKEIAIDTSSHTVVQDTNPSFEIQGIAAISAWLPMDVVDALNAQDNIVLADVTPSYLRMVASKNLEASKLNSELSDYELQPDGFASYLITDIHDLYAEGHR